MPAEDFGLDRLCQHGTYLRQRLQLVVCFASSVRVHTCLRCRTCLLLMPHRPFRVRVRALELTDTFLQQVCPLPWFPAYLRPPHASAVFTLPIRAHKGY